LPAELAHAIAERRSRLGPIGQSILYFETIGSTNDVAASLASSGDAEGAVVIADAQTAGRGRRGRTWFSPPSAGLYPVLSARPAGSPASGKPARRALAAWAAFPAV